MSRARASGDCQLPISRGQYHLAVAGGSGNADWRFAIDDHLASKGEVPTKQSACLSAHRLPPGGTDFTGSAT